MSAETRKACCRLVGSCLVMTLAILPLPVRAEEAAAGGMACIDQMIMDPGTDEMEATQVAVQVDGGCMVADTPVAI